MSKAYVGDIGTAIEIATFVDLSGVLTKEFLVKKPDLTEHVWDADIPSRLTAADGKLVHFTEDGDFDQAGKYYIQPHVTTGSTDHRGNTIILEVFDAFQ